MTLEEVKALIEKQGKAFEEFKTANDTKLAEIEKKGAATPETEAKVAAINKVLDQLGTDLKNVGTKLDKVETLAARPRGEVGTGNADADAKALKAFNLSLKAHAANVGRVATDISADDYATYRKAFDRFLRKGSPEMFPEDERKAMSVGSDPDGGYLVTADMSGQIVTKVYESSPIRQIASVQPISTDALEGLADLAEANAGWVSETGARAATTSPTLGKWRIPAEEMYAMPEVTQKLLDDAAIDVESWLAGKVADKLARLEATAFVTGNGVGKPRGFASYTTAATADASRAWGVLEHVATGSNGSFGTAPNGSDKLIDLVHKLKAAYRQGATFVMNRATLGAARQLKANGEYIWLPSLDAGQPSQLLGYPIAEAEDMATYTTTDALAIAFGNFKLGYQIVDRMGVRVLRDPFTNKPYVRFYTTRRVGGDVLHFEAIKFLKFGS